MDWPQISLAPIKYRNIAFLDDAPIREIQVSESKSFTGLYQAYAFLRENLRPHNMSQNVIYGNCDGTGTHKYRNQAIYRSVSEAIERWAFYSKVQSEDFREYLFDQIPGTAGMSAFPGISKYNARTLSLAEAIERWSISAWFEQKLKHKNLEQSSLCLDCDGIELESTIKNFFTVIIWTKSFPRAYGFATSTNVKNAVNKAQIELRRNAFVLSLSDIKNDDKMLSLQERRLLFFSEKNGASIFDNRLASKQIKTMASKLILDKEICGPWSRYADVWRCVLGPIFESPYSGREDVFYF